MREFILSDFLNVATHNRQTNREIAIYREDVSHEVPHDVDCIQMSPVTLVFVLPNVSSDDAVLKYPVHVHPMPHMEVFCKTTSKHLSKLIEGIIDNGDYIDKVVEADRLTIECDHHEWLTLYFTEDATYSCDGKEIDPYFESSTPNEITERLLWSLGSQACTLCRYDRWNGTSLGECTQSRGWKCQPNLKASMFESKFTRTSSRDIDLEFKKKLLKRRVRDTHDDGQ